MMSDYTTIHRRAMELLRSLDTPGQAYSLVDRGLERTVAAFYDVLHQQRSESNGT
jgi:hypothetical protein